MKFKRQRGEVVQKIRTKNEKIILEIPENTEVYLIKLDQEVTDGI